MKVLKYLFLTITFATASFADSGQMKNKFFNSLENFLDGSFEHTDFSIKSTEETKPEFSIETFKPLSEDDDGLTFFQGSIFAHDGTRETINLGFGKRVFSDDENMMYGLNVFYDHEFNNGHARTGLGFEMKSTVYDININLYEAMTERHHIDTVPEVAAGGYDAEIGTYLPYLPWAKFYYKKTKGISL